MTCWHRQQPLPLALQVWGFPSTDCSAPALPWEKPSPCPPSALLPDTENISCAQLPATFAVRKKNSVFPWLRKSKALICYLDSYRCRRCVLGSQPPLPASGKSRPLRCGHSCIAITGLTTGRLVDYGLKDSMNMGGCMAPAACDTIHQNFLDFHRTPADYDAIFTGDLGAVGRKS